MSIFGKPILTGVGRGSASGAIASFSDGAKGLPLRSLVANIEPVQDLHGYDNPWPAGGGENLFDKDNPNVVDGYINITKFSGENPNAKTIYIPISPNTTYTVSKKSGQRFAIATASAIPSNGVAFTSRQVNGTATSLTITSGASDTYLWAWVFLQGTDTGTLDEMLATIQIELGSTATAYAPYSNICPISGWSAVNVWVKPTYDPTANPTATLQLGQTVYGAMLDVTNGVLTVDRAMVDLGTLTFVKTSSPSASGGSVFAVNLASVGNGMATRERYAPNTVLSNIYLTAGASIWWVSDIPDFAMSAADRLYIANSEYDDAATFKTAMSGVQLVYTLATPITIPLTPTEISTLAGQNVVWADTGDVTVEYLKQTLKYIGSSVLI